MLRSLAQYDYAHQLAQRGYVVLAPDARAFGERAPNGQTCTWMMTAALLLGKTLVGMRVWDAMRAVDYLQTRPEVDPQRIACVAYRGVVRILFIPPLSIRGRWNGALAYDWLDRWLSS